MMASLRVFVCLLGLVVLCHSQCFIKKLEVTDPNNPPKGCVDTDGKQHDFGSEWQRECMECSCTENVLACCNLIRDASHLVIPEECELIVDKKACTSKVVLKSDNNKVCNDM